MLNETVYLPGDTVFITDIGEFVPSYRYSHPVTSLVCRTENVNTQCCRGSDGGNVGDWFFPNGSVVRRRYSGDDIYRTVFTHQVRLYRKDNVTSPTGSFECRVLAQDGEMNHTARILILGEAHIQLR
jgi:hypothetical protein